MKNELLKIGPFTIYGYGMMIALGILAAYLTAEYRAKKLRFVSDQVFYLVICCVLGGFAGSKLLFWVTEWKEILADPGFFLRTMGDGFVVFGGILGGILAGYLFCRIKKLDFLEYFDLVMPSVALAQGFGRIGCLLAGCCYGAETTCPIAITFRSSDFAPNHVALIPTQIYSSLLNFIHFGILLYVARHKNLVVRWRPVTCSFIVWDVLSLNFSAGILPGERWASYPHPSLFRCLPWRQA